MATESPFLFVRDNSPVKVGDTQLLVLLVFQLPYSLVHQYVLVHNADDAVSPSQSPIGAWLVAGSEVIFHVLYVVILCRNSRLLLPCL